MVLSAKNGAQVYTIITHLRYLFLMPYTVGIIGAARRHQGTGPFIARNLTQSGHRIAGIIGTSEQSIIEARNHLQQNYAIDTQAYTSFDQLVSEHQLDIIVISSPADTHFDYLLPALSNGCHVFCEKPLWWPQAGTMELTQHEYENKIDKILNLARDKQCYIHLNTQWPYTLKDFIRLHPNALADKQITQFAMHLSPQSSGASMLVDAASHGLSMLYHLVGEGNLANIQLQQNNGNAIINFDYQHRAGNTSTTLGFIQSNETPKPASYQINGFAVKRNVILPEYQIQLQSDQQTITIQDPLDASIEDFLASINAQLATDEIALKQGALHLYQLIEHFK